MAERGGWTPKTADPWHRLGVWLVLYGLIFAAPSSALVVLFLLAAVAGVLPLPGEFFVLLVVAGVSVPAVGLGWYLVRRGRRDQQELRDLGEFYRS